MNPAIIIQARMGSTRLPGKVRMDIAGHDLIWHVESRARATGIPTLVAWDVNYPHIEPMDVLGRYYRAATEMGADAIIRITGDCPLMAPEAITDVLYSFQTYNMAYVANDIEKTYPDGLGVECFGYSALEYAHQCATTAHDREHVSPFLLRDNTISKLNIRCPINGISKLKLSVDTQADLDFVRAIYAARPKDYSLKATLEAIERVQAENLT